MLMLGREVELPIDLLYGRHDIPKLFCDSPSAFLENCKKQGTIFMNWPDLKCLKLVSDKRRNMIIMQIKTNIMWVTLCYLMSRD